MRGGAGTGLRPGTWTSQLRTLPSVDPMDPGYRRLRYIRYADLCRGRHKSAYAEVRVMPTGSLEGLAGKQAVVP